MFAGFYCMINQNPVAVNFTVIHCKLRCHATLHTLHKRYTRDLALQ